MSDWSDDETLPSGWQTDEMLLPGCGARRVVRTEIEEVRQEIEEVRAVLLEQQVLLSKYLNS